MLYQFSTSTWSGVSWTAACFRFCNRKPLADYENLCGTPGFSGQSYLLQGIYETGSVKANKILVFSLLLKIRRK